MLSVAFDKLRDITRFPWWFLKMMRNLHIDHCRARKRQLDAADFGGDMLVWERSARYPTLAGPQPARKRAPYLRRGPPAGRAAYTIGAHTLDDYTMEEVAAVMGMNAGAVKSECIARGRSWLKCWEKHSGAAMTPQQPIADPTDLEWARKHLDF